MSPSRSSRCSKLQAQAVVFAALGDEVRLGLLQALPAGDRIPSPSSPRGSRLTRQAITKHLRVLRGVGIVRCMRSGRESRFEFDPRPLVGMKEYLDLVSEQWDQALSRLKSFVEK